jgi:hypothetical protein
MTPEELAAIRAHAEGLRRLQQQQLAEQAARAEAERKRQLFLGLGAIGGAALGFGLLKLLNTEKGKAKAEQVLESVGDQCAEALQRKVAGFLGGELPTAPPMFHPDAPIKDADYEVLDE